MSSETRKAGFLVLLLTAVLSICSFAASGKTYTGTVSDAMCGAKHMGDPASCTRGCVGKGSKYALVVGDKVYTLDTSDKATLANLDKAAGSSTTVTGTLNGDTIQVASVGAGN